MTYSQVDLAPRPEQAAAASPVVITFIELVREANDGHQGGTL